MSTLLLRLAGPMQAWGSESRFAYRKTEPAPTKSGVLGLLAAAKGIRRTEPLTELLGLSFGVRIDQPGELTRDFQTARTLDGSSSMPLTYRYYLSDAVFVAAVQGDDALVQGLAEALRRPYFPLYLGRRSCPPVGKITLGVVPGSVEEALRAAPWEASEWYRKRSGVVVDLEILRDADPGEAVFETIRDEPISFDPSHRQHGYRHVVRVRTEVDNPLVSTARAHDPFALLGG